MGLLTNLLWPLSYLMILLLLFRAWRNGFQEKYPLFCIYLLAISFSAVIRTSLRLYASEGSYRVGYWASEFATALIGFCVIWEIYRHAFLAYKGVRRLARILLCTLTALVFLNTAVALGADPVHRLGPTTLELIRNLQIVQALFLLALGILMTLYAVPLSRNVRAMLSGYGVYVGSVIISRTVQSVWGPIENPWWSLPPQLAYCAALLAWCVGLWSYSLNPAADMRLERDYERISGQTLRAFGQLREHLSQSWRA